VSLQTLRTYTIVYTGSDGVHVVSLERHRESRPVTAPAGPPLETSDGVAFVSSGTLYLLPAPFTGPARTSVDADRLFPMVWPGIVGVANDAGRGIVSVQYVDVQGNSPDSATPWQLPAGYQPVSQFLATGPAGVLRIWEPGSGGQAQLGRTISHTVEVTGVSGQVVAWRAVDKCAPNGECPMQISGSDPTSPGGDHTVIPPLGHRGFLAGGALSPDGRFLAGFVAAPSGSRSEAELAVIDMGSFNAKLIEGSTISVRDAVPSAQWAPDGGAVFFSGRQGKMHVYQPGEVRATTLDVQGSTSFAVA
jgi:hypothetical protein